MPAELALSEIADDVRRIADRLRSLSEPRLTTAAPPYASRADAGRAAAQVLADAAQAFEQPVGAAAPTWRRVPQLSDFAVGDMVAVTGHDLIVAASLPAAELRNVWTQNGRQPATVLISNVAATLATVRSLL